ncbi:hypothetical protein [Nocardioides acrostichi]|uniref:Uncharacterized protein n=1 Tax=Nocardioides acrostichi TaxID=2784339 RepID=A0A930Y6R4_9ACTN|nr:hypothetical protein [Nocardioides acrostichi]MBF4162650.1 hypothetical protein [Nocardioides acrostichi]
MTHHAAPHHRLGRALRSWAAAESRRTPPMSRAEAFSIGLGAQPFPKRDRRRS